MNDTERTKLFHELDATFGTEPAPVTPRTSLLIPAIVGSSVVVICLVAIREVPALGMLLALGVAYCAGYLFGLSEER